MIFGYIASNFTLRFSSIVLLLVQVLRLTNAIVVRVDRCLEENVRPMMVHLFDIFVCNLPLVLSSPLMCEVCILLVSSPVFGSVEFDVRCSVVLFMVLSRQHFMGQSEAYRQWLRAHSRRRKRVYRHRIALVARRMWTRYFRSIKHRCHVVKRERLESFLVSQRRLASKEKRDERRKRRRRQRRSRANTGQGRGLHHDHRRFRSPGPNLRALFRTRYVWLMALAFISILAPSLCITYVGAMDPTSTINTTHSGHATALAATASLVSSAGAAIAMGDGSGGSSDEKNESDSSARDSIDQREEPDPEVSISCRLSPIQQLGERIISPNRE